MRYTLDFNWSSLNIIDALSDAESILLYLSHSSYIGCILFSITVLFNYSIESAYQFYTDSSIYFANPYVSSKSSHYLDTLCLSGRIFRDGIIRKSFLQFMRLSNGYGLGI